MLREDLMVDAVQLVLEKVFCVLQRLGKLHRSVLELFRHILVQLILNEFLEFVKMSPHFNSEFVQL